MRCTARVVEEKGKRDGLGLVFLATGLGVLGFRLVWGV